MQTTVFSLFVYGSLRSGFHHPAYNYISKYFSLKGEGLVRGKLFDLGDYPVAVPDLNDHFIVGELYTINHPNEFSWAIAQLDDYEGLYAEADEQVMYKRAITEVIIQNHSVPAWIYWYKGSVAGKPFIESGDLLLYMQNKKS